MILSCKKSTNARITLQNSKCVTTAHKHDDRRKFLEIRQGLVYDGLSRTYLYVSFIFMRMECSGGNVSVRLVHLYEDGILRREVSRR